MAQQTLVSRPTESDEESALGLVGLKGTSASCGQDALSALSKAAGQSIPYSAYLHH